MPRLAPVLATLAALAALAAAFVQTMLVARILFGIAFLAMLTIAVVLWRGELARRRRDLPPPG